MDAGKLSERVSILTLSKDGVAYTWQTDTTVWAKVELTDGKSLFSAVGIGARAAIVTIRKRQIDLHCMLRWNGLYLFPTSIIEHGKLHWKIDAAIVDVVHCSAARSMTALGDLNRPSQGKEEIARFPAVLTEKYNRWSQGEPYSDQEITCVLVTPKAIILRPGDLVTVNDRSWHVHVFHDLDIWKNEYEMTTRWKA